jgi:hypothetical protein
MSRTRHSDADGLSGVAFGCGPGSLDMCLMSTTQVVTMSSKSSAPKAARFDPHALMSDRKPCKTRLRH